MMMHHTKMWLKCSLIPKKEQNGKMLMTIVESLQFLARQSIAIRGHDDKESNFFQLLNLRSCDNKVCHE